MEFLPKSKIKIKIDFCGLKIQSINSKGVKMACPKYIYTPMNTTAAKAWDQTVCQQTNGIGLGKRKKSCHFLQHG